MIRKTWFNILMLVACAYGAYGVLNQTNAPFTPNHWQYYLYAISPWALLIGGLKAWHRSYIWRRMLANRQKPPVLNRGEHRVETTLPRPSILEHGSFMLVILAVAAILKQLSIAHIAWWIGSLLGAWFILRLTIK